MPVLSSKERILRAVQRRDVDHLPLCFEGLCHGIMRFVCDRYPDQLSRVDFYLARGVDAAAGHSPPAMAETNFQVHSWRERAPDEPYPLMVRQYDTVRGVLLQKVRWTPDYDEGPYGPVPNPGEVRLFSDHNVPPSRSVQYLISQPENLPALRLMLKPADGPVRDAYLKDAVKTRAFCEQRGILMTSYLSGIGDPMIWMSGVEPLLMMAMDQPEFLAEYVDIVADWNLKNLALMRDAGCEYVVRRGWYESADFWSPTLFRQYLMEPLRREIALAHEAGMLYAYCMNSGIMPMLDTLAELDLDILCNIDPGPTGTDLKAVKQKLGLTMVLCGGVNNNHILEPGTPEQVRAAVETAVADLGPEGLILAPSDSILANTPTAIRNFDVLLDTWKKLRSPSRAAVG